MGSTERTKKRVQLWKKAIVHFSLCFVMGFFTGFAPTGKDSIFSSNIHVTNSSKNSDYRFSPQPVEMVQQKTSVVNRSLIADAPLLAEEKEEDHSQRQRNEEGKQRQPKLKQRKLIIIVTPTSTKDKFEGVLLRRLANTIRLVPPPLLWIVVEGQSDSNQVSEVLRKTGIMYRHLVFKENFTDSAAEMDHQRNVALKHIEHHKLSGIVHFAGLSNIYDLGFFDELRQIEVFGTWPMALLAANKKKVIIEGPVCDSSQVIGWHLRKMNNNETDSKPPIDISSFGFNSSILWDPERWGRTSSVQSTSQNSIKFVKQVVFEDETEIKGIPPEDCSKIMLWRLHTKDL
ncbi:beta-1,4-xylosyltransferase IRX9 [Ziziphus jujuba]|nr:beta-1,4-xylosyltransferase IRX9 [Ziziphus jujuba]XP_015899828.2 beta-1,4-xylosyltransferase IRX9 [Ziziphus jujuba]